MFTHYLITRFNIKVSNFGPERMDSPPMTEDWLNDRLKLFLTYTVPSALAQTTTNFRWLIYFDPDTPRSILGKVQFLLNGPVPVEIVFVNDYQAMLDDLVTRARNMPTSYIMTSRMDNDDMISCHFIQKVQEAFVPQHDTIINLNAGFEYSMEDQVLKKWNTRFKNQFITLIEKTDNTNLQSVYGFPHWRLPAGAHVINIPGKPYWIYLRHELNYSEGKITGIPVFVKPASLDDFPVSVSKLHLSSTHTFHYALRWFPKMLKRRLGIK